MDCMVLKSVPAHEHSPNCWSSCMLGNLAFIVTYSSNPLPRMSTSIAVTARVLLLAVSAAGVASVRALTTKQYTSTALFTPAAATPGCNLWYVRVSVRVSMGSRC